MPEYTVEMHYGSEISTLLVPAETEKQVNEFMISIAKKHGMKYNIEHLTRTNNGQNFTNLGDSVGKILTWYIINVPKPVEKTEFVAETVEEQEEKLLREAFAISKSQMHEEIRREIFGQKKPKVYRKPLPANAKNYEQKPEFRTIVF